MSGNSQPESGKLQRRRIPLASNVEPEGIGQGVEVLEEEGLEEVEEESEQETEFDVMLKEDQAKLDEIHRVLLENGVASTSLDAVLRAEPLSPSLSSLSLLVPINIDFLLNEVKIPRSSLSKVLITCPQLLAISAARLRERYCFLVQELGVPEAKVAVMVTRFPHILKYSVENTLRPAATFLVQEGGVERERLWSVIVRQPSVLSLSVPANLGPSLSFLLRSVSRPHLTKILTLNPSVLTLGREGLKAKLLWLTAEAKIPRKRVPALLASFPNLLSLSIATLERRRRYLEEEVGVAKKAFPALLLSCPQLPALTEERMAKNVAYLMEEVGASAEQVALMVAGFPRVLTYTVDRNLTPKIRYLIEEIGVSPSVLPSLLVHFPNLLGYSLEKRISRRHKHLVRCGVTLDVDDHQVKRKGRRLKSQRRTISLRSMLTPSDTTFFSRYQERPCVSWLAHGTITYDPYGVSREDSEEEFVIDLADLH